MSLSPLLISGICVASFVALVILGAFAWLLWKRVNQASSESHKQDLELCQVITEQSGEYLVMSSRESSLPTSRSGLITRTHPGRLPVCRIAVLVLDKEKWCKRWGLPYSAATDVYSVVHEGVEYLLCFKSQKEDKLIRGILVETMFLREHTKKIRKLGWEIKEIGDEITLDDGSFDRTPWTKFSFISTLSATSHQD